MITHVVMFQFKPDQKDRAPELEQALMALPATIEQIQHYEVGLNIIESARACDMVLISKFESLDDLQTYQAHPDHQDVLKLVREITESIHAVDYDS